MLRRTPPSRAGDPAARPTAPASAARRLIALGAAVGIALFGAVAAPIAASADGSLIVVGNVLLETIDGEQATIGDTIGVSGTWNATDADPQPGDVFTITLPPELEFPVAVTFDLEGPGGVSYGECVTNPATGVATCTLNDTVIGQSGVNGTFFFDVEAAQATDEETVTFNLNGTPAEVDLPGTGGIDSGIPTPGDWSKSGSMNANRWSVGWTIDLPGNRLQGNPAVNIAEVLSSNHELCSPSGLQIRSVLGGGTPSADLGIGSIVPGADEQHFTIAITEPDGGWNPSLTYRVTYNTCTPDGQIDPVGSPDYENTATVDIWGEGSGVIGVGPNWTISDTISKSGSVAGGAARNGRIDWTVVVPGSLLVGKTDFDLAEAITGDHAVTAATLSGIRVYERYGPSNDLRTEITSQLTRTENTPFTATSFDVNFEVDGITFKDDDWMYVITYSTYATTDGLPPGGTVFTNSAEVEGEVSTSSPAVPGRTDRKAGNINTSVVTIDGVPRQPQTTLSWNITVPGENLAGLTGPITVTDTLAPSQAVCSAGDTGADAARLNMDADDVRAVDQISSGGLSTVNLPYTVEVSGQDITITIPEPVALPQPGGAPAANGWSHEYQYVITYTTCTASGGMDAQGTVYENAAEVANTTYDASPTQNNRSRGTGIGVQAVDAGSVAVSKLIDGAGAALVPDGTTFTVHVQEFEPGNTGPTPYTEYDLQVPLNGLPTNGVNPRGLGWTIVLSEPTFPTVPGVVFGDPVFTGGAGVTVSPDGTTATVALTPLSNVAVSVTNEALLGSLSITKDVVANPDDNSAGYIDDLDQEFTFVATISGPTGVPAQPDRTFTIRDGQTVVLDNLPVGATVTFTETTPPPTDDLTWAPLAPITVTVPSPAAEEQVTVEAINTASRTLGTFCIAKEITGEEAGNPDIPEFVEVTATWQQEDQEEEQSTVLEVPTDPEAACTPLGVDLYIGTVVTLEETPLEDGDGITWGLPIWSGDGVEPAEGEEPGEGEEPQVQGYTVEVTIGTAEGATIVLENPTTSLLDLELLKLLGGPAASEVPAGTAFPVTVSWTDARGDAQTRSVTIRVGTPTLIEGIPAGAEVLVVESAASLPPTIRWSGVTWSTTDENVTLDPEGNGVTVVVTGEGGSQASITATNAFEKLALTGAEGPWPLAAAIGLALIVGGGGAVLAIRRRRSTTAQ